MNLPDDEQGRTEGNEDEAAGTACPGLSDVENNWDSGKQKARPSRFDVRWTSGCCSPVLSAASSVGAVRFGVPKVTGRVLAGP